MIRNFNKYISESSNILILEHLIERGIKNFKGITISEKDGVAYFWLYNLYGKIVGYQRYNPLGLKNYNPKEEQNKLNQKYYTYLSDFSFQGGNKASFWGWQFYDKNKKELFLVEGIFDAVKIVNLGYNVLATLGNDPTCLKQHINILKNNHKIYVIADNDEAGKRLLKYGDVSIVTPGSKDLGELSEEQVSSIINELIKNKNSEKL